MELSIIASDEGPGIADMRKVMDDGYTTSGDLALECRVSEDLWMNLM